MAYYNLNQYPMKKLFVALVLAASLLTGCQIAKSPQTVTPDPYEGWNTYTDPQGEFTLRYPDDWTQTDAKDEVQFWDNFDDGRNSIKMSLTKNPAEVKKEEPQNPTNNKEVTIARGTSLNTPYERYEYPFETFTLSLTALFNDDTPELRELATKVQESVNFTPQP